MKHRPLLLAITVCLAAAEPAVVAEAGTTWQDPLVRQQQAARITELLRSAAEADRFGFGASFYPREARRLLVGGSP